MKIYIKNTITNEIQVLEASSYESLSKNFRQEPYVQATQAEIDAYELEEKRARLIEARKAYLDKTDWYITREIDEPNSYPQAVKDKRVLARQEINEIETATDLSNYSEEF